ncbi:MAG: hypothetical protein GXP42_09235 [Chloroflexi bacterium]|nr:hypothetical protein [Chloroflexota bacterium]
MKTLEQHLSELPLVVLEAIARRQGLVIEASSRGEWIAKLAAVILDAEHLRHVVDELDHQARAALADLLAANNRIPTPTFERKYGAIRRFGPGRLQQEQPWNAPVNIAERLWYWGLITRAFVKMDEDMVECVGIPADMAERLPLSPQPNRLTLEPIDAPDEIYDEDQKLLDDLATTLIYAHNHRLWVNDDGRWRAKDLHRVWRQWLEPPPALDAPPRPGGRADLIFHLLRALDLVVIKQRRLTLRAATVTSWLNMTREAQMAALVQGWRESEDWDDLCLTPNLVCEKGNWRHNARAERNAALALLADVQPNTWHAWDAFVEAVHRTRPDFLRPDGNYHTWYIRDAEGLWLKGFEHWPDVEGRYLRYVWSGPLFWLGLIAWDASGKAWRLTQAGAAHLGLASASPPSSSTPPLQVTEDFEIILPSRASIYDRFRVARFCIWVASKPEYRYRITQRGLQRAAASGVSPQQVLHFLEQASHGNIPDRVRKALAAYRVG